MLQNRRKIGLIIIICLSVLISSCGGGGGTPGDGYDKDLAPPTVLSAQARNESTILLTWQDNSDTETAFVLERTTRTKAGGSVDESGFNIINNSIERNTALYYDHDLVPSTKYFYRVRAKSLKGVSPPTNVASDTTYSLFDPRIPTPPDAKRVDIISSRALRPVWEYDQDNIGTVDGWKIFRSSDNANYTEIALTGRDDNVWGYQYYYEDFGLSPAMTYYYKIVAYNEQADSSFSGIISNTTLSEDYPDPPLLDNIAVLGDFGSPERRFHLSWGVVDGGAVEHFTVERNENGGSYSTVQTNYTSTQYDDYMINLNSGSSYCYRVAWHIGDRSSWSNQRCATADLGQPLAPNQLPLVPASSTQIDVSWTYNPTPGINFNVYRRTQGTAFSCVASNGTGGFATGCTIQGANMGNPIGSTFMFNDNNNGGGLNHQTTYFYVIRAHNSQFQSVNSQEFSAKPLDPSEEIPASPTNLQVIQGSQTLTSVELSLEDNSDNEEGFRVQRRNESGNWVVLTDDVYAHSGTGLYRFELGGLEPGQRYEIRVYAYNVNGQVSTGYAGPAIFNTKDFETAQFQFRGEFDEVADVALYNDKIYVLGSTRQDEFHWERDIAVARFDSHGRLEDTVVFDDPDTDRTPTGMALSKDGNSIYISAYDDTDGSAKMVFMKLNANNLHAAPVTKIVGDPNPDIKRDVWATDIAVDDSDNVYATCYGQVQLNAGNPIPSDRDIYLLRLNPSTMDISNAYQRVSIGKDENGKIAIDSYRNFVYVASTKKIDGGNDDIFVLRFNMSQNGNVDRTFRRSVDEDLGGPDTDEIVKSVTVDDSGMIYVTGDYHVVGDYLSYNIFLYKLDIELQQQGQFPIFINKQSPTHPGYDRADDIVTDESLNMYILSHVEVPADSYDDRQFDIVIFKYNSLGQLQWEANLATSEKDYGAALGFKNEGAIYLGGYTYGRLDDQFSDPSDTDAILSRFDSEGNIHY